MMHTHSLTRHGGIGAAGGGTFGRALVTGIASLLLCASSAQAQTAAAAAPEAAPQQASKFRSPDDGWFDLSGFLDEKFGFMPIVVPITEPAVGYGLAGAAAFISAPMSSGRPNITVVGGMGTENGSTGAVAGDFRNWLDGRLQTLAGVVFASLNLDFYGIGEDSALADHPLRYTLAPKGGVVQGKYRIRRSPFWVGMSYAFATTEVTFEAPEGTPGLPDSDKTSNIGGVGPSLTLDTRDNLFTPTRGTYIEGAANLFGQAFGGDDEFQRLQIIAMQYASARSTLFLGLRGQASATFGDAPFYVRPFIYMRGVPAMRYQGEEMAQIEAELRWQFWRRFSLVGFAGSGVAWTGFEQLDKTHAATAGGAGFRYELARKYGIHMGLDVAWGPDGTAVYLQWGSAWIRP